MTKQEKRAEIQRLRNIAFSSWENYSLQLNAKWGAVQFLDDQLNILDKEIKDEETKKKEDELEKARTQKVEAVEWVKEESSSEENVRIRKGSILR